MSRSAAATAAGRQRPPAPRHPRRVSGPARPARQASVAATAVAHPRAQRAPSRPPVRVVAGGAGIAIRVADVAVNVSHSRAMDRLVRSRAWIVIVGVGLVGIVAMQVSMLKLNAGIGRAVETVNTLERTNASLRGEVSRLSDGGRIQSMAGVKGFVMPAPADVTYLRSRGNLRADGARAARRMTAPDPTKVGLAGSVPATAVPALGPDGLPIVPDAASTAPAPAPAPAPVAPAAATEPAPAPAASVAPVAAITASPAGGVAPPSAVGAATASDGP